MTGMGLIKGQYKLEKIKLILKTMGYNITNEGKAENEKVLIVDGNNKKAYFVASNDAEAISKKASENFFWDTFIYISLDKELKKEEKLKGEAVAVLIDKIILQEERIDYLEKRVGQLTERLIFLEKELGIKER